MVRPASIVAVTRTESQVTVRRSVLTGAARAQWRIAEHAEAKLTLAQWQTLTEQITTSQFRTMTRDNKEPGNDGEGWFLEGRRGNGYHAIYRWSPAPGPFARLANLIREYGERSTDRNR
jgi:hypothetical protein